MIMFWIVVLNRHPTFFQNMVELVWLDLSSCFIGRTISFLGIFLIIIDMDSFPLDQSIRKSYSFFICNLRKQSVPDLIDLEGIFIQISETRATWSIFRQVRIWYQDLFQMNWEIAHQWWPLIWDSTFLLEKIPKEPGIFFWTQSSWIWVLTDMDSSWMPWGAWQHFQHTILATGNIVAELPLDWEKLQMLEIRDALHSALVGTINSSATLETWSPYLSLNNLTIFLPLAWVKFITLSPNACLGNHGLCLLYTSENLCVKTTKPKSPITISKIRLSSKHITMVVFTTNIFCAMVILMAWCWFRQRKLFLLERSRLDIDNADFVLCAMGSTIAFQEVMEATKYVSEGKLVKEGAFGTTY